MYHTSLVSGQNYRIGKERYIKIVGVFGSQPMINNGHFLLLYLPFFSFDDLFIFLVQAFWNPVLVEWSFFSRSIPFHSHTKNALFKKDWKSLKIIWIDDLINPNISFTLTSLSSSNTLFKIQLIREFKVNCRTNQKWQDFSLTVWMQLFSWALQHLINPNISFTLTSYHQTHYLKSTNKRVQSQLRTNQSDKTFHTPVDGTPFHEHYCDTPKQFFL